mmetsp:Transcript_12964/g.35875  ORF Transcript_12964/g.35875 Transcript_12964/m.35875 type:complete len:251 (-) Transcript_12964:635-1387(-)
MCLTGRRGRARHGSRRAWSRGHRRNSNCGGTARTCQIAATASSAGSQGHYPAACSAAVLHWSLRCGGHATGPAEGRALALCGWACRSLHVGLGRQEPLPRRCRFSQLLHLVYERCAACEHGSRALGSGAACRQPAPAPGMAAVLVGLWPPRVDAGARRGTGQGAYSASHGRRPQMRSSKRRRCWVQWSWSHPRGRLWSCTVYVSRTALLCITISHNRSGQRPLPVQVQTVLQMGISAIAGILQGLYGQIA